MERVQWKCFTQVVDCILENDGKIFGGAVRDMISRDMAARAFYDEHGNMADYSDKDLHPESKDRLSIPKDIDACISSKNLGTLMEMLNKKHYHVSTLYKHDAKTYLPTITSVEVGDVIHHRLKITPKTNIKFQMPAAMRQIMIHRCPDLFQTMEQISKEVHYISVDLMVEMKEISVDPPYGGLDFECNGLIQDKHGIRLADILRKHYMPNAYTNQRRYDPMGTQRYIASIQQSIRDKVAVPFRTFDNQPASYRVQKMLEKGYTIPFQTVVEKKFIPTPEETTTCIICHDDMESGSHYKLPCCNARYHSKCLINAHRSGICSMEATGKCIMCRQEVHPNIHFDIQILTMMDPLIEQEEGL